MQRIPVLNGLRGLAIIGVIFHHSFFSSVLYGLTDGRDINLAILIQSSGWLGVNLFFFLSGFVLYLPYALGKRSFATSASIKSFYAHRAKRLLPLYYFSTLLLFSLTTSLALNDWAFYKELLSYVFVTFVFVEDTFFPPANFILWSLGVEIWFSLLFPFVVLFINKVGWKRAAACIILFSLLVRLGGREFFPVEGRPSLNFISDSVIGRLDEFMLGMLGAYLYVNRYAIKHLWIQLAAGTALILLSMLLWGLWHTGRFPFSVSGFFTLPFDLGLLLVVNALAAGCRPASRALSIFPMQLMGLMCYSIYVWHAVILRHLPSATSSAWSYTAYLAIVGVISWFSYRFIEFRSTQSWPDLLPQRSVDQESLQSDPHPSAQRARPL